VFYDDFHCLRFRVGITQRYFYAIHLVFTLKKARFLVLLVTLRTVGVVAGRRFYAHYNSF
jgi:hypothetical protein